LKNKPAAPLLILPLVATLLSASIPTFASNPFLPDSMPEWQLDLLGQHDRVQQYVVDLENPRPEVWRRALIRLAAAGEPGLLALSASFGTRDSVFRNRAKNVVSIALRLTVTTQQLDLYPALRALGQAEIERGAINAELLRQDQSANTGARALGRIAATGGFKVYAGTALCRDPRPVARVYGARLLSDVLPSQALLSSLLSDGSPIIVDHEDMRIYSSVGQWVTIDPWPARKGGTRADWFEHVHDVMDLEFGVRDGLDSFINAARSLTNERSTQSWDEWWRAVDPVWVEWWKRADPRGAIAPDIWREFVTSVEGYRYHSREDSLGRSSFHVTAPPGTSCEVFIDSVRVGSGIVPIHLVGEPDLKLVRWREDRWDPADGDEADYDPPPTRRIRIRAVFPDGRTWSKENFVLEAGEEVTLQLVPYAERPPAFRGP
jgi:hypothetical protein